MDLKDFESRVNPETGLVPLRMLNDDILPYSAGDVAGFRPDHAYRLHMQGHAALYDSEDDAPAAGGERLNRALAGKGVAGTTVLTSDAFRAPTALELQGAERAGRHPFHVAAAMRGVPDSSGESGYDQSGQGTANAMQNPGTNPAIRNAASHYGQGDAGQGEKEASVEIPADWSSAHHLQRVALAKKISGENVGSAADADKIIAAEVERRNAAAGE